MRGDHIYGTSRNIVGALFYVTFLILGLKTSFREVLEPNFVKNVVPILRFVDEFFYRDIRKI